MVAVDSWEACDKLLEASCVDQAFEDSSESLLLRTADEIPGGDGEDVEPLTSGLGPAVDIRLLGGGLWPGEVVEVFGPAGSGKTQLGLTVAAHTAGRGHKVLFVTNKDLPASLAQRLHRICASRSKEPVEAEAVLSRIRVAMARDFPDLAQAILAFRDFAGSESTPAMLVIDGLTGILAPFTSAQSWAHRWRLAWSWRILRQLATSARVLLLSHTAGAASTGAELEPLGAKAQLALGQIWAGAASVRLELAPLEVSRVALALRKSRRKSLLGGDEAIASLWVPLLLDEAGVHVDLADIGLAATHGDGFHPTGTGAVAER